jgi:hypothetical protein
MCQSEDDTGKLLADLGAEGQALSNKRIPYKLPVDFQIQFE